MRKFLQLLFSHLWNLQQNIFTRSSEKPSKILCISHDLPPLTTPIANQTHKLLKELKKYWQISLLTATKNAYESEKLPVYYAKSWHFEALIEWLIKLKLEKFITFLIWPDTAIFWCIPALIKGYQSIQQEKPDAIFVIMMPYSAGLVGICLKWLTGLPLVMNFSDTPSCTDMHPNAVSRLHYHLEIWLENFYIKQSDAVVYVSQFNLDLVKQRQPNAQKSKLHLIRCGADINDFITPINYVNSEQHFQITYIGGMNGWHQFYHHPNSNNILQKLYKTWHEWGYYRKARIDYSSSSPVFVGQAIQEIIAQHPQWQNKIKLSVYGNNFSDLVVTRVLQNQNLTDVVSVSGMLPHLQAIQIARKSDLLLITLPHRLDGTPGGRISCKTYEYLMTDRPILAAVPHGENWNYLQDKPGVWLVQPTDVQSIKEVIIKIAIAKSSGYPLRFDRTYLQKELSYQNLVQDYLKIFDSICSTSTFTNYPL